MIELEEEKLPGEESVISYIEVVEVVRRTVGNSVMSFVFLLEN